MADDATEPIIAPRVAWMAVMDIATRTDMSLAEKIAGVNVQLSDFSSYPFLAMRMKLMAGVQRSFEKETAEKLAGGEKNVETDTEIDLTASECVYLDMAIRAADFKGALTFKKSLWRTLTAILEREAQE